MIMLYSVKSAKITTHKTIVILMYNIMMYKLLPQWNF